MLSWLNRLSTGTLHCSCDAINNLLQDPQRQTEKLVYYTSQCPKDITNAIFILGAFACLHLGATAEEAWQPFSSLPPHMCLPYRDATWVKSTYDLHVQDCWSGLVRAVEVGLYNIKTFNKDEVPLRLSANACTLYLPARMYARLKERSVVRVF